MQFILKKFLILSLLTLVIPIQVKSHDIPAHEICLKASDYAGCIKTNSGFSYADKTQAIGVLAYMECKKRNHGSYINEDKALIDVLKKMDINPKIRKDSEVKSIAKEFSYLIDQKDCQTTPAKNFDKIQKVLDKLTY